MIKFQTWVLVTWYFVHGSASALELIPWTDARRIEYADRIVIGSLKTEGDKSIITVEKVLKGKALPVTVVTKCKPARHHSSSSAIIQEESGKVLWMERDKEYGHQPLTRLSYIQEGSPEWLIYHSLIDPAPLVRDRTFADSMDAVQVLGFLFKSVNASSEDAPMIAKRLIDYEYLTQGFPWSYEGQIEVCCRLVRGAYLRMKIEDISLEGKEAIMIRHKLEALPLDNLPKAPPEIFTLHIDSRKNRTIGSVSYNEAADFLRGYLGLLGASQDRPNDAEIRKREEFTRAAMISLKRMRDIESVPRVIEIALQVDANHSRLPFDFLAASADTRTVKPMGDLLDQHVTKYPEMYWFSEGSLKVLGAVGDPATLPYFEMGVRNGVPGSYYPLTVFGGKKAFEVLINQSKDDEFEASVHGALCSLIRRSNYESEPWMKSLGSVLAGQDTGIRQKWKDWWAKHEQEIEIIRSIEEAEADWYLNWAEQESISNIAGQNLELELSSLTRFWWIPTSLMVAIIAVMVLCRAALRRPAQ